MHYIYLEVKIMGTRYSNNTSNPHISSIGSTVVGTNLLDPGQLVFDGTRLICNDGTLTTIKQDLQGTHDVTYPDFWDTNDITYNEPDNSYKPSLSLMLDNLLEQLTEIIEDEEQLDHIINTIDDIKCTTFTAPSKNKSVPEYTPINETIIQCIDSPSLGNFSLRNPVITDITLDAPANGTNLIQGNLSFVCTSVNRDMSPYK